MIRIQPSKHFTESICHKCLGFDDIPRYANVEKPHGLSGPDEYRFFCTHTLPPTGHELYGDTPEKCCICGRQVFLKHNPLFKGGDICCGGKCWVEAGRPDLLRG